MNKIFAKRLVTLRIKHGYESQEALGEAVGKAGSTIAMYERGEREPDFETVVQFAKLFGTTTDYMLGQSEYDPSGKNVPIGIKVKLLRKEMGFNLQELAEEIGTSKQKIIDIEKGRDKNPDPELIRSIAIGLGVDEYYFTSDEQSLPADLVKELPLDQKLKEFLKSDNLEYIKIGMILAEKGVGVNRAYDLLKAAFGLTAK